MNKITLQAESQAMKATVTSTGNTPNVAPLSTLRRGECICHDGKVFILFELRMFPNGGSDLGFSTFYSFMDIENGNILKMTYVSERTIPILVEKVDVTLHLDNACEPL